MEFIPLGTSSATPTRSRAMSCYALLFDSGTSWLFDCAEGSQMRLMAAAIKPPRIARIFITHLHGDHVLGLPGLLLSMSLHGRRDPVWICGPSGLRAWIDHSMTVTGSHLPFSLEVIELSHDRCQELVVDGAAVSAHPIEHSIASFAFEIRFPSRRGRIDMAAVRALGIDHGPTIGRLAAGQDVQLDDGRVIGAAAVCGPPRPGPSLLICGDTCGTDGIPASPDGVDLLLHEATYSDELSAKAATWAHSCAGDAGRAARRLGARLLLISHFSARYGDGDGSIDRLVAQAAAQAPQSRVLPAQDLQALGWDGSAFNEIPCARKGDH